MAGADDLFICEVCGGVYPETCPKCPDRGSGRGCTVGRIKDSLRRCKKHADLTDCRKHFGRHIATLKRSDTEFAKVSAIHIENLVMYQRNMIRQGWA